MTTTTSLSAVALSVRQPWAWLLVTGQKDIENRSWNTHRRGLIWIHTGRVFDADGAAWVRERFGIVIPDSLPLGAIIGSVHLSDCVRESPSPWFQGPYGFVCRQARALENPISCTGQLSFFDVQEAVRYVQ